MRKIHLLLFAILFIAQSSLAQITFPRNGVYDDRDGLYAFTNATIHKSFNETVENAILLIRDGKIESIGTSVSLPAEAIVIDLKGKHIYPSLIDIYSDYGLPERKRGESNRQRGIQQMVTNKDGAYIWNQALRPEFRAHEVFNPSNKDAKAMRKMGFGSVLTHQKDGISRGTSTFVTLGDEPAHQVILKDNASHHLSFSKGTSTQSYPGSLMGGIALLRQTYIDGEWYQKYGHKEEFNISLASWNEVQSLPQIFEVRDRLDILRVAKIGKEFGKKFIYKSTGDEYRRLDAIKATGADLIVELNFPEAMDVEDPFDALRASLTELKHWELAPTNAARIEKAGIKFALTTNGLKKKSDFMSNLRKAIKNGLSEEAALKALTHTPAKIAGVYDQVGSLEKGKLANFIITSGKIFDEKTKIHQNWIRGKAHLFKDLDKDKLAGAYDLKLGSTSYQLNVKESDGKASMVIFVNDSTEYKVKHTYSDGIISLSFPPSKEDKKVISLSGTSDGKNWSGRGTNPDGSWLDWSAKHMGPVPEKKKKEDKKKDILDKSADGKKLAMDKSSKDKKKDKKEDKDELGKVVYPFMAYGWSEKPQPETYLFKNATVWTNEKDGILEGADVLVQNGKIKSVGKNLSAGGATEIDATGKHITSGIIDEHSHIAISRGVNECTQSSTAEVRIGDVVNSEDINIYRQLSGGVTISQLLHGSCNPIGGQSALIKLRWGYAPEQMKFENTDGFIKFALGENVKKSRSSRNNRFPDSRMGVEQVYVDAFTRAREYEAKKKLGGPSFRKDLDMEALVEILNSQRFITCHSYVQSEINMLMHVADAFGFKVNTFTHILEGYKVADKMKQHGAGGSTFSDWWAYKYEVIDAIPYNAAIMTEQGVITALNSDDAEMARRLNQEAAKAVLYGDVNEEEAWKMVTLNPAKLLHIDDRVGSLKAGKDADLVLWSDHPLSVYAKAEITLVDGIKFFDRKTDIQLRQEVALERARLVQKMIAHKKGGGKTGPMRGGRKHHYHCDSDEDEMVD